MKTLLSLDLSTTCTGYSVFDIESKKPIAWGKLKPSNKGISKLLYPKQQLVKMNDLADQIFQIVSQYAPDIIVIEEVSGSKNRLGQKVLDGFHFIVAQKLMPFLDFTHYFDVTGTLGWRTLLQLRLSEADKKNNNEAKKLNKTLPTRQKLPIIGPKHLACQYVNRKFGTNFDVEAEITDSDVADSMAMGDAFLLFRLAK